MRKYTEKFIAWCAEDTPAARFERSVVQAIVGIVCGIITYFAADNAIASTVVAPAVMAFLAPFMAVIGKKAEDDGGN